MEYKISNDQFIIKYEGFRIIMELKEKFFCPISQFPCSGTMGRFAYRRSLIPGILRLPGEIQQPGLAETGAVRL